MVSLVTRSTACNYSENSSSQQSTVHASEIVHRRSTSILTRDYICQTTLQ